LNINYNVWNSAAFSDDVQSIKMRLLTHFRMSITMLEIASARWNTINTYNKDEPNLPMEITSRVSDISRVRTVRARTHDRRCAYVRGRAWNSLSSPRTDVHDFYGMSRRRAILSDINGSRLDKWAGREGTCGKTRKTLFGLSFCSANDVYGF